MDNRPGNQSHTNDTRDNRTGQGERPAGDDVKPSRISSSASEVQPRAVPDNPVNAVAPRARPSDYTMEDIDEGRTPEDEGIDSLVDPSLGNERMSTNPDVLDLDGSYLDEGEEPSFSDDPGTTDLIEVIEEGDTYFAPTDPPDVRRRLDNAQVMGGFAGTSLEEPDMPDDTPERLQGGDDEIAERVRYALAADSYTTDLNIEVEVEDGIVYLHGKVGSLDDIEQAEQVAGSVPGVADVEEDLEIL